jgi:DNA-binding transcriptional MocR family regulator
MSHIPGLTDLDRESPTSLTQQMVDAIREAIERGDLAPGDRLPPTRALAEDAGVNHLTAVRAYRRLAEAGFVSAAVGRGTFVRRVPPTAGSDSAPGTGWQSAILPERTRSYTAEMFSETYRSPLEAGVISLATGWPDPAFYPVDELAGHFAAVLAEERGSALNYLNPEGLPALREQIAVYGRDRGFAADAEEIVVTSGARQAIDLAVRSMVVPGDVVAVESPTFMGCLSSLQLSGAHVVGIPVDDQGVDVAALERVLARHEIKLLAFQSSSHNPTGVDVSDERRARLLELARERSFFLLEDGVYATVRFDEPERKRMRSELPSHVVYVDSLSKTIGGGLRLGWVAASGPVRQRIAGLKLASDMHTSSLVQHATARYLADGSHERLLAATNPRYHERRDAMLESLGRRFGDEATWIVPTGGHHVWVQLRRPVDERLLYGEAVRQGVAFTPGAATMADPGADSGLRLSFSLLGPEQLDEGVRRLAAALRSVRRDAGGSIVAFS